MSASEKFFTINFVEDGLTAFSAVWYRGQELTLELGSPEWESTLNTEGKSWLELDEDEQLERWGVRYFRPGKWSGKGFDLDDPELTEEEKAALQAVEEAKKAAEAPVETPKPVKKAAASRRSPGRPPKAPVVK